MFFFFFLSAFSTGSPGTLLERQGVLCNGGAQIFVVKNFGLHIVFGTYLGQMCLAVAILHLLRPPCLRGIRSRLQELASLHLSLASTQTADRA